MKFSLFFLVLFVVSLFIKQSYSQGWSENNSGVSTQLNSVVCFSFRRAWSCGNNGTVLKTSPVFQQGWTNVSGNGIPAGIDLINITCPSSGDSNIAITTGTLNNTAYVYRTTNAGANWIQVFSQLNGRINSIWFTSFFPNTNVFMQGNPVGGRWSLWKSTNSGLNWDSVGLFLPQSGGETGWSNSMYCFDDLISFGTNNSKIYYSTNSGSSWSIQSSSPESNIYTITKIESSIYFAGGSTLLKTTNYGTNWLPNPSMGSGNFGGLAGYGENWWYVRSDNRIYLSSNNGSSWVVQYTAPAGNYTNLFFWNNTVFIYAVRTNGGISRYQILAGINQISNENPQSFSLSQNYPNPFNPSTKIRFQISKSGFVNMVVYDILGREITTRVNENLSPGTYEVDWDASKYPSGVYYYRFESGNDIETKKMILLK